MCYQRTTEYFCANHPIVVDILCSDANDSHKPCPPEKWGDPVVIESMRACPVCRTAPPTATEPDRTSAPTDLPLVEAKAVWEFAARGKGLIGDPESPINQAIVSVAEEVVKNEHREFAAYRSVRTLKEMLEGERQKIDESDSRSERKKRRRIVDKIEKKIQGIENQMSKWEEEEEEEEEAQNRIKEQKEREDQGEKKEQGEGEYQCEGKGKGKQV